MMMAKARSKPAMMSFVLGLAGCLLFLAASYVSFDDTGTSRSLEVARLLDGTSTPAPTPAPPPSTDIISNEYIITTASSPAGLLATHGGTLIQVYTLAMVGFSATLTAAAAAAMTADAAVTSVEPNYKVTARGGLVVRGAGRSAALADDIHRQRQASIVQFNMKDKPGANWGLGRMSSVGAKNENYIYFHDGEGIDMYVLDTGINAAHVEFASRIGVGKNCYGADDAWTTASHGTHVTSLAAGASYGAGRKSMIHPVQVLNRRGEGTTISVLCGMEWTLKQQTDYNAANAEFAKSVANLSFGIKGRSQVLDLATDALVNNGISVVVAAGNDADDACNYSPQSNQAITVGALDDSEAGANPRSVTSNYGSCVTLFGPGKALKGASSESPTASTIASGTSTSAGLAAGVAATFLSEYTHNYAGNTASGPAMIKEKMIRKAEPNRIPNAGDGSPNLILQTSSSMCQGDAQCPAGTKCRRDGTCIRGNLKRRKPKFG